MKESRRKPMPLVVIESPLAGDVEMNVRYARAAMADSFRRGEAPYASHIMYPSPFMPEPGVEIPISRGLTTTIDVGDLERVTAFEWTAIGANGKEYAGRKVNVDGVQQTVYLHRFLLDADPDAEVDHRDGQRLNNRRSNLRLCTHQENMANVGVRSDNTTGFKGVRRSGAKWIAYAKKDGRQIHLGTFDEPEVAARAYDTFAAQTFGRFARLNFPGGGALDDLNPKDRELGMHAGFAWGDRADLVAVYRDLGITSGMRSGIARAEKLGQPIEYRHLTDWGYSQPKPRHGQ